MVGVIEWDLIELRPDFRATEMSYRFINKVMSETMPGVPVVIQFFRPYGDGMRAALSGRYQTLLDRELESRHTIGFSPFSRQIDVVIQSDRAEGAFRLSAKLPEVMHAFPTVTALGPLPISSSRQKSEIGYRITLLLPLDLPLDEIRSFLREWRTKTLKSHRGSALFIHFDVDPR